MVMAIFSRKDRRNGILNELTENERREILYKAARRYGKQRIVDHISFLVNMRLA